MSKIQKTNNLQNYIQNDTALNAKNNLLRTNYETQKKVNEQTKNDQLQSASIAQQKLLKYLPEYNAAMGLYGNGVSESILLDADAKLRSRVGQIHQQHNDANAQLLQNYNDQKMALYDQASNEFKSTQEKNYNLALETIANWTGSSEELKKYKETISEKLSNEQMQSFLQQYNTTYETVKQDEVNQAAYGGKVTYHPEATATNIEEVGNGKNFKINVGNEVFGVQFDEPVNNQYIKNLAISASVPDGGVFEVDNALYYKNGQEIYKLEAKPWDAAFYGQVGTDYAKLKKKLSESAANGT